MRRRLSARAVFLVLAGCAGAGVLAFSLLVWRAVSIEHAEASQATERFRLIRSAFGASAPLLDLDEDGRVTRRTPPPREPAATISRVKAIAYQPSPGRLVQADSPLWFLELKGPAAQLALRETGFDPERLSITASDLKRYGPAIVVDHTSRTGARLLVWTE